MKQDELFECFYSVIDKGSGKEIATFFNEQLDKAKGSDEDLDALKDALQQYKKVNSQITEEMRDIFKTLIEEVNKHKRKEYENDI